VSALKAAGPHGYSRLHDANTPILTPWRAGAGLPGYCRGHVLTLAGQTMLPTGGLQRSNALDADAPGYSLTLPAAAKGLAFSFVNAGAEAVDIYALGALPWFGAVHLDTIDGQPNAEPCPLAAGQGVTLTCNENGKWVSATSSASL
jgi:hypothetical protein